MKVVRIYMRVSTNEQSTERQERALTEQAKAAGFYIAACYREKASGADVGRPELARMIDDLQPGEFVLAEKIDRISRLPLAEAVALINAIKAKGAKLAVPGIVDLSEIADSATGVAQVVLNSVQDLLLKVALQMARDDYETRRERQRQGIDLAKSQGKFKGRQPDQAKHNKIIAAKLAKASNADAAEQSRCSLSTVKRVWGEYQRQAEEKA